MRQLVKGQFLEEVGEHLVNGIVERFYQVSAETIDVSQQLKELPGFQALSRVVGQGFFDNVRDVYDEAVREKRGVHFQFHDVHMTPEELGAFMIRVARELEAYQAERPGAFPVRWVAMTSIARVPAYEPRAEPGQK
ncbi:hypothetical protein [Limnochorda pilosa]|uniref:hypothetical protein n=1 Tax=Limnochorda pilosa TaxID=1555112 RepID=UPI0011875399|nr:hypothetical protein [Limnochorda pilosa]